MHLWLLCARYWTPVWDYEWSRASLSTDLLGKLVRLGEEDEKMLTEKFHKMIIAEAMVM